MISFTLTTLLAAAPSDGLLDAAESFERAAAMVAKQQRACQDALAANLRQAANDARRAAAKRSTNAESIQSLRLFAAGMILGSGLSPCPSTITDTVSEGLGDLNRAYDAYAAFDVGQGATLNDLAPPPAPAARHMRAAGATMGRLSVAMNQASVIDGSPSLTITTTSVILDAPGSVYFGLTCRPASGGQGTEWSTTRPVRARAGQLPQAGTFNVRYSTLDAIDAGDGRFVCHLAVFDEQGQRELASSEVSVMTPQTVAPPPMAAARGPAPAVMVRTQRALPRDCGTGSDPGCDLVRFGRYPMNGAAFGGLMTALRATRSDLTRESIATKGIGNNLITAAQLGVVMDAFSSDLSRLDVVKAVASNVVDPEHALQHSTKFRSSLSSEDYVGLMTR
jgi:hypothetical protein